MKDHGPAPRLRRQAGQTWITTQTLWLLAARNKRPLRSAVTILQISVYTLVSQVIGRQLLEILLNI